MGADERLKCIVIRISAGTAAAAARVVVKSSGQELKKRNTRAAFNSAVRPLGSAAAAPPRIHPLRPRDSVALLAGSRADLVRYDACTVVGATRLHGRAGSPTTTRARAPARSSAGTGTETRLARTRAGGMRVPGAPARTDAETQHFVPGFGTDVLHRSGFLSLNIGEVSAWLETSSPGVELLFLSLDLLYWLYIPCWLFTPVIGGLLRCVQLLKRVKTNSFTSGCIHGCTASNVRA